MRSDFSLNTQLVEDIRRHITVTERGEEASSAHGILWPCRSPSRRG